MGSQFEPHATSYKDKVKPVSCLVLSKRLTIESIPKSFLFLRGKIFLQVAFYKKSAKKYG
jgi:hypothetical protein